MDAAPPIDERGADGRHAEPPPEWAPGTSLPLLRPEAGRPDPVSWPWPGKPQRKQLIAASSVLAVAAAVLTVAVTRGSAQPETEPKVEGISGWFTPMAPADVAVSPDQGVASPPPPDGDRATVPDGPQRYVPPGDPPPGDPPPGPGATSPSPQNATAYRTRQAEDFDEQSGIKVEPAETGSGEHIGFITSGDWVRYDDVGFTGTPARTLLISASNWAKEGGTGEVEVRLDSRANAPIGRLTIPNNASWFAFQTYTMTIRPTTGVHNVYLTFTSKQTEEFANVDWIRFQH